MRGKKYTFITLAVVLGWMVVIFLMSHQPAQESSAISDTVSYRVIAVLDQVCGWNLDEAARQERAKQIHHPVRKAAHMTEYALLAILVFVHLCSYPFRNEKKRFLIAALLALCYAATDEYHQTFIAGRSGNLKDVGIDFAGALIGLLLLAVCRRLRGKKEKKDGSVREKQRNTRSIGRIGRG